MRKRIAVLVALATVSALSIVGTASASSYLSNKEARSFANKVLNSSKIQMGDDYYQITATWRWSNTEVRYSWVSMNTENVEFGPQRCTGTLRVFATGGYLKSRSAGDYRCRFVNY